MYTTVVGNSLDMTILPNILMCVSFSLNNPQLKHINDKKSSNH